jgi:hypothetical protein
MTQTTTPPVRSGAKDLATYLAGATLGLSAFGASGSVVYYQPEGGSLTAADLNDTDSQFQIVDIDLTDLGAISATLALTGTDGSFTFEAGHLYLGPEDIYTKGSQSSFAIIGDGASDAFIAKSGPIKARVFTSGDLIDFDAFNPAITGVDPLFFGFVPSAGSGYIGFVLNFSTSPMFGWVEFEIGSMTLNCLGVETTPGQGITAGPCAVPVPPTLALLATGIVGLAASRRRRRLAN